MAPGELRVGGLTPLTTIDFPGELAAVVFCQGCPWRCRYCHNAELIPTAGESLIPWERVLRFLERRRGLLDAVVFSGGEPTLQDALAPAIEKVRSLGFRIGLHTAGMYPDRLEALIPRLDWVGLDIKALPEDYPAITGVPGSGAKAWDSARRLIASGVPHEVRITVHPSLLAQSQVREIGTRLAALGSRNLRIQPCRTDSCLDPALPCPPPIDPELYADLAREDGTFAVRI